MKRKIIISLVIIFIVIGIIYYFNRYVPMHSVRFENDEYIVEKELFKSSNENIIIVLDFYNEKYKIEDETIYIKYKKMTDKELIYNYTNKSKDSIWLKQHFKIN